MSDHICEEAVYIHRVREETSFWISVYGKSSHISDQSKAFLQRLLQLTSPERWCCKIPSRNDVSDIAKFIFGNKDIYHKDLSDLFFIYSGLFHALNARYLATYVPIIIMPTREQVVSTSSSNPPPPPPPPAAPKKGMTPQEVAAKDMEEVQAKQTGDNIIADPIEDDIKDEPTVVTLVKTKTHSYLLDALDRAEEDEESDSDDDYAGDTQPIEPPSPNTPLRREQRPSLFKPEDTAPGAAMANPPPPATQVRTVHFYEYHPSQEDCPIPPKRLRKNI